MSKSYFLNHAFQILFNTASFMGVSQYGIQGDFGCLFGG